MGTFSKDKKTKKSGPKGKKARKQAKLENRWGETVHAEEIQKKTRRGTTSSWKGEINRKLSNHSNAGIEGFYQRIQESKEPKPTATKVFETRTNAKNYYNDDDDDDDDSSASSSVACDKDFGDDDHDDHDEGMDQNPMGDLLTMIQQKGSHRIVEDDSEDSDEDSEDSEDEEYSESESDQAMDDSGEISDDEEDISKENKGSSSSTDLFRKRFGRPPLTQKEVSQLEDTKPALKKIPLSNHFELQFTSHHLQTAGEESSICQDLVDLDSSEAWRANAHETYRAGTREVLQKHWKSRHSSKQPNAILSDSQAPVYSFLSRYADVFDVTSSTGKGHDNSKSDRQHQSGQHRLQVLHILNHILTSRTRIGRNNRYVKESEDQREKDPSTLTTEDERDVRDQGFTRPSILVLLPTRMTCHRFVKDLYKVAGAHMEEEQEDRFDADYGEFLDEEDQDAANKVENHRKAALESKGKEWNEFFGDKANQDDDFKIGISLIPKTVGGNKSKQQQAANSSNVSIKLYSDFFKSDIIVASPLGLKMILESSDKHDSEEEEDDTGQDSSGTRKGNFDYLSSIEICLIQYSDVILMQNWDHVNDILSCLNQEPKNNNNTDFSRVRNYLLEGQGAFWRQLIISSKFWDPSILSTFKRFGKSWSGHAKVRRKIRDGDASIAGVLVPIKQVFQKIPTGTFAQQSKARVDYFVKHLLPQLERNDQKHTLVFIPSYFDFLALRNSLLKLEKKHKFVSITEYARGTEINRGRARFLQGRKPLMLYTGRAHYFHRHAIKGVRNLIVLGLPEHAEFYAQFVNLIQTSRDEMGDSDTSCLTLFTKYEAHALERVVGSSNASRMMGSPNSVFMFYS